MAPPLALRGLFVCLPDLSASFIWPLFISGPRFARFASAVSWPEIRLDFAPDLQVLLWEVVWRVLPAPRPEHSGR